MKEKDIFGDHTFIYSYEDEDTTLNVDSNNGVFLNGKIIGLLVSPLSQFTTLFEETGIIMISPYHHFPPLIASAN